MDQKTKKRFCSYLKCYERRVHHEYQDIERGQQIVLVDIEYPEDKPCYCCFTCAIMDHAMSIKYEDNDKKEV